MAHQTKAFSTRRMRIAFTEANEGQTRRDVWYESTEVKHMNTFKYRGNLYSHPEERSTIYQLKDSDIDQGTFIPELILPKGEAWRPVANALLMSYSGQASMPNHSEEATIRGSLSASFASSSSVAANNNKRKSDAEDQNTGAKKARGNIQPQDGIANHGSQGFNDQEAQRSRSEETIRRDWEDLSKDIEPEDTIVMRKVLQKELGTKFPPSFNRLTDLRTTGQMTLKYDSSFSAKDLYASRIWQHWVETAERAPVDGSAVQESEGTKGKADIIVLSDDKDVPIDPTTSALLASIEAQLGRRRDAAEHQGRL